MTTGTPIHDVDRDFDGRLLLVGDSHGNTAWLTHVIHTAHLQGITRILQVGDFGLWPGRSGEQFLLELSQTLDDLNIRLDFIDGNHDDHAALARLHQRTQYQAPDGSYQVHNHIHWWPRGTVTTLTGRRIGFCGGAISIDRSRRRPGQSWWPEEEVTGNDIDALLAAAGDHPLDLLVTHDAPAGFEFPRLGNWTITPDVERDSRHTRALLAEAVEYTQPQLVIHGHWHRRHHTRFSVGDHTCDAWGLAYEDDDALAVLDLPTLTISDLGIAFPSLTSRRVPKTPT